MTGQPRETKLFWERFKRFYPVKVAALAVIVALTTVSSGKEASLAIAIKNLNYDSLPAKAPRPTKPAEKLHAAVVELTDLLELQAKGNLSKKQAKRARSARSAVSAELQAVEGQFAADAKKLGGLKAKAALKRLSVIEAKTAQIKQRLVTALAGVPKSGSATPAARGAIKQLIALSPEKPQQPLSSDLSFGIKNAQPRSVSLSAGITPAYQAPSPDTTASNLPREPESADLQETDETKFTPAIEQLATQLANDPVKIYEYVRNNIRFEPYYGIRKGADQTLAEKAGSDADQAALLIALLRQSGIHARFVQGVAELPAAKAANWLGVDVAAGERIDAVPEILWSGGIPTTQVRANGQLSKVRFNHFWVEAYVAGEAYRGVDEGVGAKRWMALDTSIKKNVFTAPQFDFKALLKPAVTDWTQRLIDNTQAVGDDGFIAPSSTVMSAHSAQLLNQAGQILQDHGLGPDSSVADVVGGHKIAQANDQYVASSKPFRQLEVSSEFRRIPEQFQASVMFQVSGSDPLSVPNLDDGSGQADGFSFAAPTTNLANRRITVAYVPAATNDAEIIDAYHGLLNAPTYAASLIPVLRIDGRVVASGHTAVSTGYMQGFKIVYRMPGFPADVVENPVYVGSLSAVALDLGDATAAQIKNRGLQMDNREPEMTAGNVMTDLYAGDLFSNLGTLYFYRNDLYNSLLGRSHAVSQQRQLSGGIVATNLDISYVASFPVANRFTGFNIDVDQDAQSVVSLDGNSKGPSVYMGLSGINASASEGEVLSVATGTGGVSTASIFGAAMAQAVPLYVVSAANADRVLEVLQYPTSLEAEIRQAVAAGAEVTIPEREVTIGGWTGAGYVVRNNDAYDFRIVGGASGGYAGLRPGDPGFEQSESAQRAYADYIRSLHTECHPGLAVFSAIALVVFAVMAVYIASEAIAIANFAGSWAVAKGVSITALGEYFIFKPAMDNILDCLDRY